MTVTSSLLDAIDNHPLGLCGRHETARCVLEIVELEKRLNVLVFGVVLDTNFLSAERWSALVASCEHWLLDPSQVAYRTSAQVLTAMQGSDLRIPRHIARVWWQICRGVQGRFKGSWLALLKANDNNARTLQTYLQDNRTTFPVLAGPIVSAGWLDLVHRLGGVPLQEWGTLAVKLSASQAGLAKLFGIEKGNVHPQLASALSTWSKSCQGQMKESCGLKNCPKRVS